MKISKSLTPSDDPMTMIATNTSKIPTIEKFSYGKTKMDLGVI